MLTIQYRQVNENEPFKPPYKSHQEDAGIDIHSSENGLLEPLGFRLFSTNLACSIPPGYSGILSTRSGMAVKGISVRGGVIDSGYENIIGVCLINSSKIPYNVKVGDRICQMRIVPVPKICLRQVDNFENNSERGMKGFGSSGR